MRKRNAKDIGSIIKEVLGEKNSQLNHLQRGVAENRVVRGWNEVLGEGVASYTSNVYLNRGVLTVYLKSSVLRAELMMNKEGLINKLNEHAEMKIVRDIIFR